MYTKIFDFLKKKINCIEKCLLINCYTHCSRGIFKVAEGPKSVYYTGKAIYYIVFNLVTPLGDF